jgi:predicted esterase
MPSLRREDGVALFYEEAQGDDPPVLLIHGIGCDHTTFAPQFEHFARIGHRVVAVDLRGHGKSDKPHQSYTMQLFTDDLAWMCEQLGLQKPLLVNASNASTSTVRHHRLPANLPPATSNVYEGPSSTTETVLTVVRRANAVKNVYPMGFVPKLL